jgi:CheY-like chemotaxis protein
VEEKITILAVDDSVVNLKLIKAIFDKHELRVHHFSKTAALALNQMIELQAYLSPHGHHDAWESAVLTSFKEGPGEDEEVRDIPYHHGNSPDHR